MVFIVGVGVEVAERERESEREYNLTGVATAMHDSIVTGTAMF